MVAMSRRCRAQTGAIWLGVLVVVGWEVVLPQSASAAEPIPLIAVYQGEFTLTFGSAPGGDNELVFSGDGLAVPLGISAIAGRSVLRPTASNPLVSDIIDDHVTLTAANGDQLFLVNSGQDAVDFSDPNRPIISGHGTFTIGANGPGGSGRFRHATGGGVYAVYAEVTEFGDGSVSGTFSLLFLGSVSK
jgi:hypothetical protein